MIFVDLSTKDSEKNIAERNNISTNSINRILDDISDDKYVKNNDSLPTSFGIDEFSATKDTISKLALLLLIKNQGMSLILIILDFQRIFMNTFLDIKGLIE